MLVTVRDESPAGRALGTVTLEVPETIVVRDLIRARVREEVAKYNAAPNSAFRGLVTPEGASPDPDGSSRLAKTRRIDWEAQAKTALEAFTKNGFFVLVAGRQVADLDEVVDLSAASDVSFVRLVPLVGG
jgi:hypothetical protein